MKNDNKPLWYTRPVFFVSAMEPSLHFYIDLLGFNKDWSYTEGLREIVAQVHRGSGCELILSEESKRAGESRVFISIEAEDLAGLQKELKRKDVPVSYSWWGYDVLVLKDPDGNEILFPVEQMK